MRQRWHSLLALFLVGCSWQSRDGAASSRVPLTSSSARADTPVSTYGRGGAQSAIRALPSTPPPRPVAPVQPPVTPTLVIQPTPTFAALTSDQRLKIFDAVWQTVADHYLYQDFHGVDWQASRQRYRPRAALATTPAEFYAIIGSMIEALHDEHSRFISPQTVVEEGQIAGGTEAFVGVGVSLDDDKHIITTVFPDSPAVTAGLRRRDRILAIDGKPAREAGNDLHGPNGSTVQLRVQSPGTRPRNLVVRRRPVSARLVPEAYRLPHTQIGYLLIQSLWSDAMDHDVQVALQTLVADGPLQGLIIDLRGNGGGWRSVLLGILQNFERGTIGSFTNRDHSYPIDISPGEEYATLQHVPMVVLVDHKTESYAEVLAASLQANGRAKVIGTQTAGNTETIYAHDFDDGSRLWLSQEAFTLPDGRNLEGQGLRPDVVVDVPWEQFSEADDPQIKRALRELGVGD